MNVIKLEFSLKQITPMIHFQNENGATIRATELKPKLDRFILLWMAYENNKVKCNEQKIDSETEILKKIVKEKDYDNWIIDEKHIALNYKMRIKAEDQNRNMDLLNYSNKGQKYLGNANYILDNRNKDEEDKYVSTFSKKILVKIFCFDELLADKIIELLPILIDLTAFGLQQSKGYGNFRVDEIFKENKKQQYKPDIERNYIKLLKNFNTINNNVLVYKLELDKEKNDKINADYAVALNAIAEYNRFLKSGLRLDGIYIPSVIMKKYFKQNGYNIINEKKAMKQKLHLAKYNIENLTHHDNKKIINNYDFSDSGKIYYTRGLLGFAQLYQFSLCIKKNHDKFDIIPRYKNGKEKKAFWKVFDVKGKIGKEEISRFPSPLHYHVSENYKEIYIIVNNNSLISLQNENPIITFKEKYAKEEKQRKTFKKDKKEQVEYVQFTAKLPDTKKFDFESFFKVAGLDTILFMANVKNKFNEIYEGEYFLTKLEDNQNER